MRWTQRGLALLAVAMLLAVSAQAAMAETTRVDREFDTVIQLDENIAKYGAVGVGDFNGDGYDDVLFQAVLLPVTSTSTRWVEMLLGPFDDDAEGTFYYPAVTFNLSRGNRTASIAVADINGDGMDDITFAESSRKGIDLIEHQKVSMLFGRTEWEPYFYIGEASRGDRKLDRRVPLPEGMDTTVASVLTIEWADLNHDGHLDLIMAADPPDIAFLTAPVGTARTISRSIREGNSRIAVMYGDSEWLFWEDADEELDRPAGWVDRGPFRDDALVEGLGQCERSLVGVGDVSGDGLSDLVTRRCASDGVPDQLGYVEGKQDGLRGPLAVRGAIPDRPPPDPGQPRRPPPVAGYYRPPDAVIPSTLFERVPSALIEDFNDDDVADVAFEFSDKTHIFLGGEGIESRLMDGRSDRILMRAGTAGLAISRTWQRFDVDGDGTRDLMFTLIPEDRLDDPFNQQAPSRGNTPSAEFEPIHLFTTADTVQRSVLDLSRVPANHVWDADPSIQPWAIGDFNGDGIEDVLLGSHPGIDRESRFPVLFGPFVQ